MMAAGASASVAGTRSADASISRAGGLSAGMFTTAIGAEPGISAAAIAASGSGDDTASWTGECGCSACAAGTTGIEAGAALARAGCHAPSSTCSTSISGISTSLATACSGTIGCSAVAGAVPTLPSSCAKSAPPSADTAAPFTPVCAGVGNNMALRLVSIVIVKRPPSAACGDSAARPRAYSLATPPGSRERGP